MSITDNTRGYTRSLKNLFVVKLVNFGCFKKRKYLLEAYKAAELNTREEEQKVKKN